MRVLYYLMFCFSFSLSALEDGVAEDEFNLFLLKRSGSQLTSLPEQNYFGFGGEYRASFTNTFLSTKVYWLKSDDSEAIGVNIAFGFAQEHFDISLVFMGEEVEDTWYITCPHTKTCTNATTTYDYKWGNTNYREHWYVKYEHKLGFISPIIEFRYISKDDEKYVTNHIAYGVKIAIPFTDNRVYLTAMDKQDIYTIELSYQF